MIGMRTNRVLRFIWVGGLVAFVVLVLYPVSYRTTQIIEVGMILALWAGAAYWTRKSKWCLALIVAIVVGPGICLILPARGINNSSLRNTYVKALCSYEGTRYWWGGENLIGIDCSGLVRRAMINALVKEGVRTLNGRALRSAVEMWWYDTSARALRDGYRNQTVKLTDAASINTLDHSLLQAGDIAVTENGVHVMAYVGQNIWIEADPAIGKVVKVKTPSEDNGWFKAPVQVMRWGWFLNGGK
jgi:hypothetical protein